jgi:cytochrome c-type biogenesis protein CcmH
MARLRLSLAITALVAGLSVWSPAFGVSTSSQREIEESLTCQCGCGLTVAACNHLECGFAVPVRKHIAEALAAGQTAEQILADYKKEYGEKVLSSPVPEGFNLLAWIAPFVAILAAGGAMFAYLRRRRLELPDPADIPSSVTTPDESDKRLAQLRHEVEDLER